MLKHLPEKSLETFPSGLLNSNKSVVITNNNERRANNANDVNDRSNGNLDDRITKFHSLVGTNNVYRIPLRFLVDLGLVNFPVKFDSKFLIYLHIYLQ